MTAYYTIMTPAPPVTGEPFGVVADDTTARYLFPDGSNEKNGLDDERVQEIAKLVEKPPTNALEWLNLACTNVGIYEMAAPVEAEDLQAAFKGVADALEARQSGAGQFQTRAELLAWQRQMMDEWAEDYPEAAAGDVDDPEADLALAQLLTPPTNPEKPHKWLPLAVQDVNCGFCDQPAEADIHVANADTITSGSN